MQNRIIVDARPFNLFSRRISPELRCAVPEDQSVPGFLDRDTWEFCGKIEDPDSAPPGFDLAAAAVGVRFNGFYLFQALAERR